jgi:hypothetical protein
MANSNMFPINPLISEIRWGSFVVSSGERGFRQDPREGERGGPVKGPPSSLTKKRTLLWDARENLRPSNNLRQAPGGGGTHSCGPPPPCPDRSDLGLGGQESLQAKTEKKKKTVNNGCLGLCNDERRSDLRQAMASRRTS